MAQKSNSHYAPQPYTNQSVFKSLLNCTCEISLSRNATGRELQRQGPATEKLLSPRRVRVPVFHRSYLWNNLPFRLGVWPVVKVEPENCGTCCFETTLLHTY